MYVYTPFQSFTPEQEKKLRESTSTSTCYENFLTDEEFAFCRKLVMNTKKWPEQGRVAKYWGFNFESGPGPLLTFLKDKITEILPRWKPDFLAFQEAIEPWKLHADIRWYSDKIPYKVILIPMDVEPMSGPVDIDHWPETFTYSFKQRNFLSSWTEEERQRPVGDRNDMSTWSRPYDMSQVEDFVPGYHIPKEEYDANLNHMPYDWFEGVTLEQRHQWKPKSLFYWDNTQLHCADNFLGKGIRTKRSLMVYTILGD